MEECLLIKIENSSNLTESNLYPQKFYFDKLCKKNISKHTLENIRNKYKNSFKLENILTEYKIYLKSSNKKNYVGYFLYKPIINLDSGFIDRYNLFYVDINADILINKETGDLIYIEVVL